MKNKIDVSEFLSAGFDKNQATSLAWCEIFENRMAEIEYKFQGRIDGTIRIDAYCFECEKGGHFLPSTTRSFIIDHKGHNTRTMRIK